MIEVTRILSTIEQGDPSAARELLPLVYDELRKLAAQKLAQDGGNRPRPSVPGSPIARPERRAEATGQEGRSTARRHGRDRR
jgi:hypothetical protein